MVLLKTTTAMFALALSFAQVQNYVPEYAIAPLFPGQLRSTSIYYRSDT